MEVADNIIKALKISMGQDIVEYDMQNIDNFADQVMCFSDYVGIETVADRRCVNGVSIPVSWTSEES